MKKLYENMKKLYLIFKTYEKVIFVFSNICFRLYFNLISHYIIYILYFKLEIFFRKKSFTKKKYYNHAYIAR